MIKTVSEPGYNYVYDPKNGYFARWGDKFADDPDFSPLGPEIADIEIATTCSRGCSFCYKSNTSKGEYMTLETFIQLFEKLPDNLMQIAFGIGDIDSNPDMWEIFAHCRDNGVTPNLTINGRGLTTDLADRFAAMCGAVAVSRYRPAGECYDAVKMLTDAGLEQTNIHMLLAEERITECKQLIKDCKSDSRLEQLNAVVFLSLKQKGKRNRLHPVKSEGAYNSVINLALENKVSIGFDSCGATRFLQSIEGHPNYDRIAMSVEPCESGLFSSYFNVKGEYFPCSFMEGEEGQQPIDVLNCNDFMTDVWNSESVLQWREKLLATQDGNPCRSCPHFEV